MSHSAYLSQPLTVQLNHAQRFSGLLKRAIVDRRGEAVGNVSDVIVRLRPGGYPPVVGLSVLVGHRTVFVPIDAINDLGEQPIRLTRSKLDLRSFERRNDEVLLGADILQHRLVEIVAARFVRAADISLSDDSGVRRVLRIATGSRRLLRNKIVADTPIWDWGEFEPRIGHLRSARLRGVLRQMRKMKPAQIADLVEEASITERPELLNIVHKDPDLEADVFEELAPYLQTRRLSKRSDTDIAAVLAKMQADDAADAVSDLAHERRLPVIDLLPEEYRRKVRTLMGFNPQTAGRLMVPECITVSSEITVGEALEVVKEEQQTTGAVAIAVFVLHGARHLSGAAPLAWLLRAEGRSQVGGVAEENSRSRPCRRRCRRACARDERLQPVAGASHG